MVRGGARWVAHLFSRWGLIVSGPSLTSSWSLFVAADTSSPLWWLWVPPEKPWWGVVSLVIGVKCLARTFMISGMLTVQLCPCRAQLICLAWWVEGWCFEQRSLVSASLCSTIPYCSLTGHNLVFISSLQHCMTCFWTQLLQASLCRNLLCCESGTYTSVRPCSCCQQLPYTTLHW